MASPAAVQPGLEADDGTIDWETPDTPASAEDYAFINGGRLVRPYFFEFLAHVKRRWEGKTIVDLFSQEFRQRPMQYYVDAVESGRIRVDGKKVPTTYVVRDSQPISHFVHRHEPPVLAEPVRILEETPDVLTVCKPPSVPVHACGQYRKNTVIGILQAENNAGPLFPIHRLDRLVSGLLIFARNAETADCFREEIKGGRVRKEYVAKVVGVFPENEIEVNAVVLYDKREGLSSVAVECDTVSSFQNRPESAERGKDSCTRFMRLSTDGRNSIVKCVPLTGRTHQIRVHLKHLGYPIANDALYLHKAPVKRSREATTADRAAAGVASGSAAECSGYTDTNLLPNGSDVETTLLMFKGCAGKNTHMSSEPCAMSKDQDVGTGASMDQSGNVDIEIEERPEGQQQMTRGDWALQRVEGFTVDRMCTRCPKWEPAGYEDDVDGIWLHCVKYAGGKWSYEAPLPNWAL